MLSPSDGRIEVSPAVLKFQLSGSESMVLRSPRALSDRLLLKTWLSMTVKLLLFALRRTAIDVLLPFWAVKWPSGDGASRLRQRLPVAVARPHYYK